MPPKALANTHSGSLRQRHAAAFELILVDDNSTDGSTELALAFARTDDRIRVLFPGATRPGKKDALAYGIAQASYERLLLTDADCTPASDEWLTRMTEQLRGPTELVLGVSPYRTAPATLLGRWQRFESIYVSFKYLSALRWGLPYMGVGRNLAYTKGFYLRAGGFSSHGDLPGGDDDLLVSGAAISERTVAVTDPRAWTYSHPQPAWPDYFRQRARHQSTGIRYPLKISAFLTLVAVSHVLFYVTVATALWRGEVAWALGVYALRFGLQLSILLGEDAGALFGEKSKLSVAGEVALFDGFIALMYGYLAVVGIKKPVGW